VRRLQRGESQDVMKLLLVWPRSEACLDTGSAHATYSVSGGSRSQFRTT
jgi:hypothetical protein